LIDYLVNRCRSYIYSTSIAPPIVAASLASVAYMPQLSQRRTRLQNVAQRVRVTLQQQGWQVPDGITPIVPVIVGNADNAVNLSDGLSGSGCYVPAIRPPTVPAGAARLRISLSSAHSDEQIASLLDAMALHAQTR
jgi:8-amino-7-oxononanoate synthase